MEQALFRKYLKVVFLSYVISEDGRQLYKSLLKAGLFVRRLLHQKKRLKAQISHKSQLRRWSYYVSIGKFHGKDSKDIASINNDYMDDHGTVESLKPKDNIKIICGSNG